MRNFFDPPPQTQTVVLVDTRTLRNAERLILGCQYCSPTNAEIPFDWILDRITGADPTLTDYIMVECMARCPKCKRELTEKTLVEVC